MINIIDLRIIQLQNLIITIDLMNTIINSKLINWQLSNALILNTIKILEYNCIYNTGRS